MLDTLNERKELDITFHYGGEIKSTLVSLCALFHSLCYIPQGSTALLDIVGILALYSHKFLEHGICLKLDLPVMDEIRCESLR